MLLFLHGPDSFRLHERIVALRAGFAQKYDAGGFSIETLHGKEITADTLPSKLLSSGLFTQKRCVVLTDIFALSDKVVEVLIPLFDRLGDDTILIVTATELPKTASPLRDRLLQADKIEIFPLLDDTGISRWLTQRVKQAHIKLDAAANHYLVHAVGSDLWRMHSVVEQLVHYTKTITLADAELFVSSPLDDNIFHLTDALSERNTSLDLRLLHDQLANGASPFYVLTMLSRQITILLQVKAGGEAAAKLHPYVQKKAAKHAERFSSAQLTTMFGLITQVDEKMKTTSLEPVVILDKLIADLLLR
ncbi:MAG: DNA polymerase III subunit delta [Candidatus Kerfeldbacteria bacterium]|nr:DNA polymerase III subunit delta [Candidatus Kerfeldbacteria bacterium]